MCPENTIHKGRVFRGAPLLPLDNVLGIVHMLQDDPVVSSRQKKRGPEGLAYPALGNVPYQTST